MKICHALPLTLALLAVAPSSAAIVSDEVEPESRNQAAAAAGPAESAEWPQFRGPERTGKVGEIGLLEAWDDGQPRVLWRRELGGGFSSVSAAGGRLFTMTLDGEEEVALCLDAASGKTIWRAAVGKAGEAFPEGGPRSTPTVADGVVYTASSQGRLVALSAGDGSLLWSRDLGASGPPPRFGYSISPLVDGELVIVETGKPDEEPGVVALDRATGELRWQALDGPAGYSSPIAIDLVEVRQYVFFRRAAAEVVSLSTTGEVLWRHPTKGLAIIVSPLFLPPDRIFVATSDDAMGGLMLRVTRNEEGFDVEEAWSERLMRNHFNTSVLVGQHLYGFDNATLRCVDAESGERRWAKRSLGKGSLIAAGDLLFVLGDSGELVLLRATPDEYRELGRVEVTKGRSWTAPSLAGGRLYVRDADELVSLDVRATRGPVIAPPRPAGAPAVAETDGVAAADLDVAAVIARYEAARGGRERWRRARTLRMTGTYAAFSESSDFELIRRRGDLYRLEFAMLGGSAIRARDASGAWGLHPLLFPEAQRIEENPYRSQFERESLFEPPLLDPAGKGVEVELLGPGEIDGRATVDLELILPGGAQEIWHLGAESFLEVAVDSTIIDHTQLPEPMRQRAFYDDFRNVDGLVLPFQVDLEFGARLETMRIEEAKVDLELDRARFSPPPAEPSG